MRIDGPALLVRIYVGEADHHEGRPLYQVIVERLRERGLAGATVLRGIEGFGANAHLHTTRLLRLSEDLPILIEVVDREDRICGILPELDELVGDGLITLEKVEVLAYRGRGPTNFRRANEPLTIVQHPVIERRPRCVDGDALRTRSARHARSPASTWLVLATDGPGLALEQFAPSPARVRTVADPAAFDELLARDRPRVAVVAEPPAGARQLDFVCVERRRRQGLRTIHLSPPGEVMARLAALRDGFDEALPQSIEPKELAARAALLEERMRVRPSTSLPIAHGLRTGPRRPRTAPRRALRPPASQGVPAPGHAGGRTPVGPIRDASCSIASGGPTRSATRGPSTSMSAGSARRSSRSPTARSTWSPSAAWGTGSTRR